MRVVRLEGRRGTDFVSGSGGITCTSTDMVLPAEHEDKGRGDVEGYCGGTSCSAPVYPRLSTAAATVERSRFGGCGVAEELAYRWDFRSFARLIHPRIGRD